MRLPAAVLAGCAVLALALPARAEEPDQKTAGHVKKLEELRGLKFKKVPAVKYWDIEKLRKMMIEEFDEEMPEEKAKKFVQVLRKFRLIPEQYDLRKEYLELMVEQIAGFYHPKKKILCLIEGKTSEGIEGDTVTIHELDHAMQDQHFELSRLQEEMKKNDDMSLALSCLVEGEATLVMMDFMLLDQTGGQMGVMDMPGIEGIMDAQMRSGDPRAKKLNDSPLYIRETLIRPYVDGFKFCLALKRKGGWEALNAIYTDLPASTEQILHPERYLERDMPQRVKLPKEVEGLDGWEKVEENTLGELGVMLVFHTVKPKSKDSGKKAAEGWDGDTYRVLEKDGATLLLWATAWDTEVDAREFASAYTKALRAKYEGLDGTKSSGDAFAHESQEGFVVVERVERRVFVAEGGSEEEARAAVEALKAESKFEEVKPGLGKK